MIQILMVALGGALGAVARYGLSGLVHRWLTGAFPFGTLAVNVVGCLAIGGFLHFVEDRSMLSPTTRLFVAVGILGGFTTFSAFGYETIELLRDGEWWSAFWSVSGNLVLGLGAVWAGRAILRWIGM